MYDFMRVDVSSSGLPENVHIGGTLVERDSGILTSRLLFLAPRSASASTVAIFFLGGDSLAQFVHLFKKSLNLC